MAATAQLSSGTGYARAGVTRCILICPVLVCPPGDNGDNAAGIAPLCCTVCTFAYLRCVQLNTWAVGVGLSTQEQGWTGGFEGSGAAAAGQGVQTKCQEALRAGRGQSHVTARPNAVRNE